MLNQNPARKNRTVAGIPVTVATIAKRENKYLMVRESPQGKSVINQPAGHVEKDETLTQAVIWESLEETGWDFEPEHICGIYQIYLFWEINRTTSRSLSGPCNRGGSLVGAFRYRIQPEIFAKPGCTQMHISFRGGKSIALELCTTVKIIAMNPFSKISSAMLFALMLALPFSSWAAKKDGIEAPAYVTLNAIPVCFDFGCKNNATVSLPITEWNEVVGWFNPQATTAENERLQIKNAIGWMEVLIGRHTPTHRDLAFDLPVELTDTSNLFPGQQDCIDEAVNTTTYLRLLELNGFLKHHTVIEQAYRQAIFDQHWAGQIRELATGDRYVVDSWFQPNGYLPVIQASKEWEDINILSAVLDDSDREDGKTKKKKSSYWKRILGNE